MKKTLLLTGAILMLGFSGAVAQCTPDQAAIDSYLTSKGKTWGAMPDTIDNLPLATQNQTYSGMLQFKIPHDAGEIDPQASGLNCNSLRIVPPIVGFPPGITNSDVQCDQPSCSWSPPANGYVYGCVIVGGTPTALGTYPLGITLEADISVVGTQQTQMPGYKIVVQTAGIDEVGTEDFKVSQNVPNPFTNITTIEYSLTNATEVNFNVVNILGENVHMETIQAKNGKNLIKFDGTTLPAGIYMYTLETNGKKVTKRMIINK